MTKTSTPRSVIERARDVMRHQPMCAFYTLDHLTQRGAAQCSCGRDAAAAELDALLGEMGEPVATESGVLLSFVNVVDGHRADVGAVDVVQVTYDDLRTIAGPENEERFIAHRREDGMWVYEGCAYTDFSVSATTSPREDVPEREMKPLDDLAREVYGLLVGQVRYEDVRLVLMTYFVLYATQTEEPKR